MNITILSLLLIAPVPASAMPERALAELEAALSSSDASFDGTVSGPARTPAPAPVAAASPVAGARPGAESAGRRGIAPVQPPKPPSGHVHYFRGVPETSPRDNIVSGAAAIRGAGAAGHLLNALPPLALYGAVRSWSEALAGERGEPARKATLAATIIVPLGAMMIGTLTLFVIMDNAWNAAEDAVAGRYGITN